MQLAKYLDLEATTQADFAGRIGLSIASVSRLASGRQTPSLATIRAIEKATGGRVTAADFELASKAA